jgi:hypothetical protein
MTTITTYQRNLRGREITSTPYVSVLVLDKPTTISTASNTITITGGTVEVGGFVFSMTTGGNNTAPLNLATLGLPNADYVVELVARYQEPLDKSSAEALGLRYYVENKGEEGLLKPFVSTTKTAALNALGGYDNLYEKVAGGIATPQEVEIFADYTSELQKLQTPNTAIRPLAPIGYDFVLTQTAARFSPTEENSLYGVSETRFKQLRATIPFFKPVAKVMTEAQAVARYTTPGYDFLIESAASYATLSDANNALNGTPIVPTDGEYDFTGAAFVRVYEYFYSAREALGQKGFEPIIVKTYTKSHSLVLGRTQSIYLDSRGDLSLEFSAGEQYPLTRESQRTAIGVVSMTNNAVTAFTNLVYPSPVER